MAKADSRKVLANLKAHHRKGAPTDMRRAFERDPSRFAEFSAKTDEMLLDYSKCAVNSRTMKLLAALAKACDVEAKRDDMFAGAIINTTEQRAVLHIALRNRSNTPIMVYGQDVMPEVNAVLAHRVLSGRCFINLFYQAVFNFNAAVLNHLAGVYEDPPCPVDGFSSGKIYFSRTFSRGIYKSNL